MASRSGRGGYRGKPTEQALTYAMFDNKRTVTADILIKVKRLQN